MRDGLALRSRRSENGWIIRCLFPSEFCQGIRGFYQSRSATFIRSSQSAVDAVRQAGCSTPHPGGQHATKCYLSSPFQGFLPASGRQVSAESGRDQTPSNAPRSGVRLGRAPFPGIDKRFGVPGPKAQDVRNAKENRSGPKCVTSKPTLGSTRYC